MPKPVLVIYTGGTIGSKPRDPDPDSPQVVVEWEELKKAHPEITELGFVVDCISTPEPLDSCNIGPTEWQFMAAAIEKNYEKYSGFVILHGTDTMVYTASALSFMLRNLTKPVVLTGAQTSAMVNVRNDAKQNFISALTIANPAHFRIPVIPEVVIYFGGKVLRGNRAVKRDTAGYDAYETPNLPPLAEVGDSITVNTKVVLPMPTRTFTVKSRLDTGVLPVLIYPGVQNTEMVRRQLADESLKAAIVMSFGSGNIPTKPEFLKIFEDARARGIVVANISQCHRGPVELGIYETSAALLDAGFVSGGDMTLEAATTKLMSLLGDPDLLDADAEERQHTVERDFEVALAGETTESIHVTDFGDKSGGAADSSTGVPGRGRVRAVPVVGTFDPSQVTRALIRLRGSAIASKDGEAIAVRTFLNLDPDSAPVDSDPGFAGATRRWPSASSGLMVIDITAAFKANVKPGERLSFTVVVDTADSKVSWERAEIAVFASDLLSG